MREKYSIRPLSYDDSAISNSVMLMENTVVQMVRLHRVTSRNYTTFSLWDTYRAAHPLMTILHPDMQKDIAQTMVHIFKQQGEASCVASMGNKTDCMVGNPGVPMLTDITLKGFDVDKNAVFEAAKASAIRNERFGTIEEYGYIPC